MDRKSCRLVQFEVFHFWSFQCRICPISSSPNGPSLNYLRKDSKEFVSRRNALNRNHERGDAHALLGCACQVDTSDLAIGMDHCLFEAGVNEVDLIRTMRQNLSVGW